MRRFPDPYALASFRPGRPGNQLPPPVKPVFDLERLRQAEALHEALRELDDEPPRTGHGILNAVLISAGVWVLIALVATLVWAM